MAVPQPGPEKRHIPGLRIRYHFEMPETSAAEFFLHLGAFHEGHAAHLHRAPDHSGRVTPRLSGNSVGRPFPQFRFDSYAGHAPSMRKILEIARKRRGKSHTAVNNKKYECRS
jgi:hypothetical protein